MAVTLETSRVETSRVTLELMGYSFDRLGFLQFEQLCASLLEQQGGIDAGAWSGEADRCRSVLSGAALAPPLTRAALPAPVLVQCAWVRDGG